MTHAPDLAETEEDELLALLAEVASEIVARRPILRVVRDAEEEER